MKLITPVDVVIILLLLFFALFQFRKVESEVVFSKYEVAFSNGEKQLLEFPKDSGITIVETEIGAVSLELNQEDIAVVETYCRHKICKHTDIRKSGSIVCVPGRFVITPVEQLEKEDEVDFIIQ